MTFVLINQPDQTPRRLGALATRGPCPACLRTCQPTPCHTSYRLCKWEGATLCADRTMGEGAKRGTRRGLQPGDVRSSLRRAAAGEGAEAMCSSARVGVGEGAEACSSTNFGRPGALLGSSKRFRGCRAKRLCVHIIPHIWWLALPAAMVCGSV